MRRACVRLCHPCRSFVVETLQNCPNASFVDIISQWHCQQSPSTGVSAVHGVSGSIARAMTDYDVAEVQLLNKFYEEPMSSQFNRVLQHYSTAHFAAELGSTVLLELLFSRGVVLHGCALEDAKKLDAACRHPSVSLETVVRFFPSIEGYYLSHLAARNGHLNFIRCLVEHFGAETVLAQRTAVTGQWQGVGAPLNVYGTAFVHGNERILEWVDSFYPAYSFTPPEADALCCVQRASAHSQVRSLEYFARIHGAASQVTLREALYPAAEVGAEDVLNFLVETLGADSVWWPSDIGATTLHHAARLGRTELLNGFFQRYDVRQHVDDTDCCGRTPAMWCVMGGKRQRNIEFLQLLLLLGSQWPITVDRNNLSVESLARLYYLPHSNMRKFIAKCIASADWKD